MLSNYLSSDQIFRLSCLANGIEEREQEDILCTISSVLSVVSLDDPIRDLGYVPTIETVVSEYIDLDEFIDNKDLFRKIGFVVSSMSKEKRRILNLAYYDDKSFADISVEMGKDLSDIATLHYQALEEIKFKCLGA